MWVKAMDVDVEEFYPGWLYFVGYSYKMEWL
jgi:hypothetical protein